MNRIRVTGVKLLALPLLLSAALPANGQIVSGMLIGNEHNILVQTCLPNREEPVLLRAEVNQRQLTQLMDTNMQVGLSAIPDPGLRDKYLRHAMMRLNVSVEGDVAIGRVRGRGGEMYHGTLKVKQIMIAGASRGLRGPCAP